jgi:hypothetical protein
VEVVGQVQELSLTAFWLALGLTAVSVLFYPYVGV